MGISDQLKNTNKGRLSYERKSSGSQLKNLLNECSSPPLLQVSRNFSQNVKSLEECGEPAEEKKDSEKVVPSLANSDVKPHQILPNRSGDGRCSREPTLSCSSGSLEDVRIVRQRPRVTSPDYGKTRLAIHKYEEEFDTRTQKAILQKKNEFVANRLRIEREAELNIQRLEHQANFDTLMKIQDIELRHESQAAEIVKQHKILRDTHEQRKQEHQERIQEAEHAKHRLRQEEIQKKEQENKERQEKLNQSITDLTNLVTKIQREVGESKHQQYMSEGGKKSLALMASLMTHGDNINKDCRQKGEVTLINWEKCQSILDQAGNAYEFIKQELDKAEIEGKKAEEAEKLKQQQQQQQQQLQQQQQTVPAASVVGVPLATSTPVPSQLTQNALVAEAASSGESLCVALDAFKQYTFLQTNLTALEQAVQVMSSTAQLKKLKFDIQKAVNTPINAISPVSGSHLRDKLKRLLQLLAGQTVEVSGRGITLNVHPAATSFCKHLIAKMIVKKGEEQVSSKHESAFAIAMVAVGLWREQPDMGDLYLAHFHQQCPYLVPYYIPKQDGQTDVEYHKARGYKYDEDGTVEKQEKFLKRMSGIMRLYFAIMITSPPRGSHPHGTEHAWIWLSRVLNMEPELDITATMLFDFLQVAGHSLYNEYRKQFLKLLHILVREVLPKLKNLTSASGGGSLSRLQLLLETSVKNHGSIPPPEGYLQASFWRS